MTWQRGLPMAVMALLSCAGDNAAQPSIITPPAVTRVDVTPATASVAAGGSVTLSASTFDASGASLSGRSITWSTSAASVATVSQGVVTGVAAGSATITATSEGRSGTAQVTVTAAVARVNLAPTTLTLAVGGTGQLTATPVDGAGNALPGRQVTFLSANAAVATVGTTGLVTGVASGTTQVTAVSEGQSASATVTVSAGTGGAPTRVQLTPNAATIPSGNTVQLTATAFDAAGNVTTQGGPPLWTTSNTAVASVSATGLVTGLAAGAATITATISGIAGTSAITVTSGTASGNVIDVNPGVTYQTITGWQALTQNGWLDCNRTAFNIYKDQLHDRAVNELGINRMTLQLRSGAENTVDYFTQFVNGLIDNTAFNASWFVPINDNADPNVADPTKFFWGFIDGQVDNAIVPLQQRLAARGEKLYVVLQYIDFTQGNTSKPFLPMKAPAEYAELIVETFKHLKQKYNLVPDALELVLEPEHTPYDAADIGRAIVATVTRLRALGYNPAIIAPSTTSMLNAHQWYDTMILTPGIQGMISELAYHRYVAVSFPSLQTIGQRVLRDGIQSSMLEHINSGFDDLYEDLTVGFVSAWQQYTLAFCGTRDNPDNGGVYYQVNQADPNNPKLNITNFSKLFRQLFLYVRAGAVRIGATSGNATTLLPLAFRNTNGKLVTVVRARAGASFAVRGLPAGTYGINYSTPGTQWNVNLPDQVVTAGGQVQATIPGDGVITIYAR